MKRRKAFKHVAVSVGIIVGTPSILSLLNACTSSSKLWQPEIIPAHLQKTIEIVVDVILPKSESPSASELNLSQFVDKMMFHTESVLAQEYFVLGLEAFQNMLEKTFNKALPKISVIEIRTLTQTLCSVSEEEGKRIFKQLDVPLSEIDLKNKNMYLIYFFMSKLRYYCLFGYYTSQEIMEGIQDFNPNLGYYQSCIS